MTDDNIYSVWYLDGTVVTELYFTVLVGQVNISNSFNAWLLIMLLLLAGCDNAMNIME